MRRLEKIWEMLLNVAVRDHIVVIYQGICDSAVCVCVCVRVCVCVCVCMDTFLSCASTKEQLAFIKPSATL